jgi:hypothetical protein
MGAAAAGDDHDRATGDNQAGAKGQLPAQVVAGLGKQSLAKQSFGPARGWLARGWLAGDADPRRPRRVVGLGCVGGGPSDQHDQPQRYGYQHSTHDTTPGLD